MIGNNEYASTGLSNKYLTVPNPGAPAFPTASDDPILHSANDVFGLGVSFGTPVDRGPSASREFTFFNRYGTNGLGHDLTEALSYETDMSHARVSADGTSLKNAALIGYRDISYSYDPLLSPYNPFAGNRLYFARGAIDLTRPTCTTYKPLSECAPDKLSTAKSSISLALVRANNGMQSTYSAAGMTVDGAINSLFYIDAVFMRSEIAGSIEGRLTGKSVVLGTSADTLLNNNAASLSLSAKVQKLLSLSVGLALADKPSCSGATECASTYSRS